MDVRRPDEYSEGHIPGARSIPLDTLPERLVELDRTRPTLVYCKSGGRAGNGTCVLTCAGFERAVNIGGLPEWNGLVANGAPEAGMAVFAEAHDLADHVALAWIMEEGARLFYRHLAGRFPELSEMFEVMAVGERHHRDRLAVLYRDLTGDGRFERAVNLERSGG